MSGDIKEIVNNLNKANSKKDSDDDVSLIENLSFKIMHGSNLNFFSWIPFVGF